MTLCVFEEGPYSIGINNLSASRRIFFYFKFKIFLPVSATFLRSSFAFTFSTVLHPLFACQFPTFFFPIFFKFSFGAIAKSCLFHRFQLQNGVASKSFSWNACFFSHKAKYVIFILQELSLLCKDCSKLSFSNVWSKINRFMLKNHTFRLSNLNWDVEESKQLCRGGTQNRYTMFVTFESISSCLKNRT